MHRLGHGGDDRLDGDSELAMPLTREFKATIMADLRRDRAYRAAYLAEAIECMHGGEFDVGKRMLRNCINGALGFKELSKAVGSPLKSLVCMLSEKSNPHADKLFEILGYLQSRDHWTIKVVPTRTRRSRAFERRVYRLKGLPPEIAAAIKASKMDASHDHLNALLGERSRLSVSIRWLRR